MIDAFGTVASVALPWIAGAAIVRALWRGSEGDPGMIVVGYGYLVGAFTATLLMRAFSLAGIAWSLPLLGGALAALGVAAWALAPRTQSLLSHATQLRAELAGAAPALRWLFWIAFALIAVRLAGLALEIAVVPLRAYDAWAHWATKARVWLEQGQMMAFVPPDAWLTRGDPALYTDANPGHPGLIPLLQAWTGHWLTGWNESLVNAPWIAIAIALAFAIYSQARLAGASAPLAMTAAWLVLSLPVLDGHVGLAGCADLFMAATYGMAAMAAWRWSITRELPMAWLAVIAALAGVTAKNEGLLWAATLVPGVVVALNRRAGFILAGLVVAGFLAFLALGPEQVTIMNYRLRTRPVNVLGPLSAHVFAYDNWHLLGYAVVAIVAWRFRILLSPRLAPLTMTMFAAMGLIVVVYFFSNAAGGVADETLVNRLLLHLAPAVAYFALFVYLEGRVPSGDQPSLQATSAAEA